ncbi:uncharacterized protein [Miscanthus floridulus]|uniref:uncharacterized protein isoform X2 n=1 Tax=Miscanthus floridulus TaxID=154761 RepID=UPI00345AEE8A
MYFPEKTNPAAIRGRRGRIPDGVPRHGGRRSHPLSRSLPWRRRRADAPPPPPPPLSPSPSVPRMGESRQSLLFPSLSLPISPDAGRAAARADLCGGRDSARRRPPFSSSVPSSRRTATTSPQRGGSANLGFRLACRRPPLPALCGRPLPLCEPRRGKALAAHPGRLGARGLPRDHIQVLDLGVLHRNYDRGPHRFIQCFEPVLHVTYRSSTVPCPSIRCYNFMQWDLLNFHVAGASYTAATWKCKLILGLLSADQLIKHMVTGCMSFDMMAKVYCHRLLFPSLSTSDPLVGESCLGDVFLSDEKNTFDISPCQILVFQLILRHVRKRLQSWMWRRLMATELMRSFGVRPVCLVEWW